MHDDDLFAYFYYRDKKRVDQFNSCPDYFEAVSDRANRKYRGRPELLRDLLDSDVAVAELSSLLTQDRSMDCGTLDHFAQVLGLANAVTAYEYLRQGETEGIEQWPEFVHVPDLAEERAQSAAIEQAQLGLAAEGVLLFERAGEGGVTNSPCFARRPGATDSSASGGPWPINRPRRSCITRRPIFHGRWKRSCASPTRQ